MALRQQTSLAIYKLFLLPLVLSIRDWYLCGTISDHIFRLLLLTWFMQADITQFNDHPIVRRMDLSNISSISWSKEFVAIFILFLEMLIYLLLTGFDAAYSRKKNIYLLWLSTIKHAYSRNFKYTKVVYFISHKWIIFKLLVLWKNFNQWFKILLY